MFGKGKKREASRSDGGGCAAAAPARPARGRRAGARLAAPPRRAPAARVFCVSDVHSEHEANMEWCRAVAARADEFRDDVLIVAGDVSPRQNILKETLSLFKATFAHVFFTPGNHDLWVRRGAVGEGSSATNSLERLHEILNLCRQLGIHTSPAFAAGVIIAPLFSWYHSSFDKEPDIVGWTGIPEHKKVLSDFIFCSWPGENSSARAHFTPSVERRLRYCAQSH